MQKMSNTDDDSVFADDRAGGDVLIYWDAPASLMAINC